jgi:hypothetical protein
MYRTVGQKCAYNIREKRAYKILEHKRAYKICR